MFVSYFRYLCQVRLGKVLIINALQGCSPQQFLVLFFLNKGMGCLVTKQNKGKHLYLSFSSKKIKSLTKRKPPKCVTICVWQLVNNDIRLGNNQFFKCHFLYDVFPIFSFSISFLHNNEEDTHYFYFFLQNIARFNFGFYNNKSYHYFRLDNNKTIKFQINLQLKTCKKNFLRKNKNTKTKYLRVF